MLKKRETNENSEKKQEKLNPSKSYHPWRKGKKFFFFFFVRSTDNENNWSDRVKWSILYTLFLREWTLFGHRRGLNQAKCKPIFEFPIGNRNNPHRRFTDNQDEQLFTIFERISDRMARAIYTVNVCSINSSRSVVQWTLFRRFVQFSNNFLTTVRCVSPDGTLADASNDGRHRLVDARNTRVHYAACL